MIAGSRRLRTGSIDWFLRLAIQAAFPTESGHILDCLALVRRVDQAAQRFLDGSALRRQASRTHGFGDQGVVDLDVRAHLPVPCV